MPKLFKIIQNDQPEVVREALWVFSNAAHNAYFEDVVDLVKVGWMKLIIDILESNDLKTLEICLESLCTMF